MGGKVMVGLSGGVDSSVTALLLCEQGFEVEALFMKNWDEPRSNGACLWEADVEDAMQVCDRLGIPLNTVDLSREYWDEVFVHFLEDYRAGLTPNPDVLCNQEVKFRAFADRARELGAARIATGHYARLRTGEGPPALLKGRDADKDQSYFLCRVRPAQFAATLFPVGELEKRKVRALARRAGLPTHDKKDSTGICFIGERPFRDFLAQFLPPAPGEIRTADGRCIGRHEGAHFYTIGQRHGLGIGGVAGHPDAPWYVAAKDPAANTVTVVQGRDHPLLFSRRLRAQGANWFAGEAPATPLRCGAKTRYRQPDQACTIESLHGDSLAVTFDQPQRAVTPGQYVVFYDGDTCLGGAVIRSTDD